MGHRRVEFPDAFSVQTVRRLTVDDSRSFPCLGCQQSEGESSDDWSGCRDVAFVRECLRSGWGAFVAIVKHRAGSYVRLRGLDRQYAWGSLQVFGVDYPALWRRVETRLLYRHPGRSLPDFERRMTGELWAQVYVPVELPVHLPDATPGRVNSVWYDYYHPSWPVAVGSIDLPGPTRFDDVRPRAAYAWFRKDADDSALERLAPVNLSTRVDLRKNHWRFWKPSPLGFDLREAFEVSEFRGRMKISGTGFWHGRSVNFCLTPVSI